MSEISGGELLARAMAVEGIEFLFGLPSPEIDPLLSQLEAHGIRLVPVRHEAAGVHMAEGLYKTTGRVAAVLGNPGPGSANLLARRDHGAPRGRAGARADLPASPRHRLPLDARRPSRARISSTLFRPTVKWGGPILEWARIPEVLRLAFREMWNGRPGPVHIELPAPMLYDTGDDQTAPIIPPAAYRGIGPYASAAQLDEARLLAARAASMIAHGRRPRGGNGELLELVELLGCPVLTIDGGSLDGVLASTRTTCSGRAAGDGSRAQVRRAVVDGGEWAISTCPTRICPPVSRPIRLTSSSDIGVAQLVRCGTLSGPFSTVGVSGPVRAIFASARASTGGGGDLEWRAGYPSAPRSAHRGVAARPVARPRSRRFVRGGSHAGALLRRASRGRSPLRACDPQPVPQGSPRS